MLCIRKLSGVLIPKGENKFSEAKSSIDFPVVFVRISDNTCKPIVVYLKSPLKVFPPNKLSTDLV